MKTINETTTGFWKNKRETESDSVTAENIAKYMNEVYLQLKKGPQPDYFIIYPNEDEAEE